MLQNKVSNNKVGNDLPTEGEPPSYPQEEPQYQEPDYEELMEYHEKLTNCLAFGTKYESELLHKLRTIKVEATFVDFVKENANEIARLTNNKVRLEELTTLVETNFLLTVCILSNPDEFSTLLQNDQVTLQKIVELDSVALSVNLCK